MTQLPIDGMSLPDPDPDDRTVWWNTAYTAVVEHARLGRQFTIYEATRAAGVGEPHHPSMWGVLTGALHRDGIIAHAGATAGSRPTVAKSLVHVWIGAGQVAA